MDLQKWNSAADPDALLSDEGGTISPAVLRQFAAACARRVLDLWDTPHIRRLLEVAEKRAAGVATNAELEELRDESSAVYDSVYPGYGSASPRALALAAAGEAVATDDPLTAARSGSATAARARAAAAAEKVDDSEYDAVHDAAYAAERAAQADVLRQYVRRI